MIKVLAQDTGEGALSLALIQTYTRYWAITQTAPLLDIFLRAMLESNHQVINAELAG